MTYFLYLLTFGLSFARPELGLLILTFALATVGSAWGHTSIPGLGSLQLSDFAVLGLAVNLISHPDRCRKPSYLVWFLIPVWIVGIAVINGVSRPDGLKLVYDLVMRYGLLWLIPIIVAELSPAKRRTLLLGMLACGLFVTGVQAYTYVKRDPAFAVQMYFQFQDPPAYNRPETDARREFRNNAFPRLYPRGALLVQALMVFVLVSYMSSGRRQWSGRLMAGLFCLYGLLFLSLRQRSGLIGLAVALWLFFRWSPAGTGRRRLVAGVVRLAVAGAIATLAYQAVTGADFVDDFTRRFRYEDITQQYNRMNDNWLALQAIATSPLTGTGASDLEDLAQAAGGQSLGLDVHPVLAVPVLGGLPLLLLIFAAVWHSGKRCLLILSRASTGGQSVPVVISIVYMSCLAVLNFAGIFTLTKDMLPMLLFVGIIEGAELPSLRTVAAFPHRLVIARALRDKVTLREVTS